MLNRDISDSKGYAKLSPAAAVLFCMMIPHYSPHGKMNGDPGYLKGEICPRIAYLTVKNIPSCLKEITEHTSVKWFEHESRMWIHSINFLTEHQQINLERVGPDLLPNYSGVGPDLLPPEVEVKEEVEVKGEGEGNSGSTPESKSFVTRPKGNGRFTPPTLEEVSEYCKARDNSIDPVKFHAHYTSNGWRVGKNPMKSWKASVVTWERSANQ